MKNTNNLVKVLLTTTLFFSAHALLKAEENTKSDKSALQRSLEEIEFNMSEPIRQRKCELECGFKSNYPEICKKVKCRAEHLKRVVEFKFKHALDK